MAGKRKGAKSLERNERRLSSRVQELRQKELDEKERFAPERVKFLSEISTELCANDTAKEDEAVHESPKRSTHKTLTTMQKEKEKLDFYANENGMDEDAHLKAKESIPDLKGITEVRKANAVLYPRKRISDLQGLDVGHRFFQEPKWLL